MRFFIKESIHQFKNVDGKKKTKFEIIKGKDGEIHQIKGITSNENSDIFDINQHVIKKNLNKGTVYDKHRKFKIRASNLNSLLRGSDDKNNKPKVQKIEIHKEKEMKIKNTNDKVHEDKEIKIKKKNNISDKDKVIRIKKKDKEIKKKDKMHQIKDTKDKALKDKPLKDKEIKIKNTDNKSHEDKNIKLKKQDKIDKTKEIQIKKQSKKKIIEK